MWESFVDALRACARVRPQVPTRYSSTAKLGLGETAGAAAERSRWRGQTGEVAEDERRWWRMDFLRRSMPARRRDGGGGDISGCLLVRWSQVLSNWKRLNKRCLFTNSLLMC
jgi:hypothetical protein